MDHPRNRQTSGDYQDMNIDTDRYHAVIAALWMSGTLVSFMALAIGGRELPAIF